MTNTTDALVATSPVALTGTTAWASITVQSFPSLLLLKTVQTISDPVNAGANPKAIPGAYLDYTVMATNSGAGTVDNDAMIITDPIPTGTELFVNDLGGAGSGPVTFTDGGTASGLSYTFTALGNALDDLEFSDDNAATWTYTPTPDVDGFDAAVTDIRVNPKGTFAGAGAGNPSFSLTFRVRL